MTSTLLNRTIQALVTNKSGGALVQGDVVIIDSTTANSVATTTTSGYKDGKVGVVIEPNGIADDAAGMVAFEGWVPKVNLSGSASLGDLFKCHSVAKQAVRHAAPLVAGDFGQVLATGTSPAAILFGHVEQGSGGAAGALVFLQSQTASNSAALDLTLLSDTYNDYLLKITGLIPASAGNNLIVRFATDATPTWDAGSNYRWSRIFWSTAGASGVTADGGATTSIQIGAVVGITAGYSLSADMRLSNLRTAALYKSINSRSEQLISSDSNRYAFNSFGYWLDSANKAYGIRLLMSSGNISSGTAYLYGIADL